MHYLKNLYCDNHKNKDVPKNSCRIKNFLKERVPCILQEHNKRQFSQVFPQIKKSFCGHR